MFEGAADLEWCHLRTELGIFSVGAGPKGVVRAGLRIRVPDEAKLPNEFKDVLDRAKRELGEYFAGRRKRFKLRLDLSSGTEFRQKVWKEMMRIPYGEVVTYGELANRIGEPKASRAVGQACRSNPIGVIVPCHRVVASNGIGGFGGPGRAIALKRGLLRFEGVAGF